METQQIEVQDLKRFNINLYSEKSEEPMTIMGEVVLESMKNRYKTSPYERKVLELGVDSGSLIDDLTKLLGTEKINGINILEKLQRDEKIRRNALAGDPLALPIQSNSLDIVASKYLFDYGPDRENILREIGRILRPGGEATLIFPEQNAGAESGLETVDSREVKLPDGKSVWVVTMKKV